MNTTATTYSGPTLLDLADEFELSLRAQNASPATLVVYLTSIRQLAAYLAEMGMPTVAEHVAREHVEAFLAHLLDTRSPATAKTRHGALKRFFGWLVDEGELTRSPIERVKPPKVPDKPVPVITVDDLRALLAVCEKDRTLAGRRDLAILRCYIDTGARLSEIANLHVDDVDFDQGVLWIRRGKGGKMRAAPIGTRTALALKRYLRERGRHPLAATEWLWVGKLYANGQPFGVDGVRQMVARRAADAGLAHLHTHQLRHTFAHTWLAAGGQEVDLMRIAGWSDRRMLNRYGASVADERARDAHHRLALGDKL